MRIFSIFNAKLVLLPYKTEELLLFPASNECTEKIIIKKLISQELAFAFVRALALYFSSLPLLLPRLLKIEQQKQTPRRRQQRRQPKIEPSRPQNIFIVVRHDVWTLFWQDVRTGKAKCGVSLLRLENPKDM